MDFHKCKRRSAQGSAVGEASIPDGQSGASGQDPAPSAWAGLRGVNPQCDQQAEIR